MQVKAVKDVYDAYFYFNKERTLSTDLASELISIEDDGFTVYIDKTRKYDNQILIDGVCNSTSLEADLKLFQDGISPEVSIAPQALTTELKSWLLKHQFVSAFEHEFLELSVEDYVEKPSAEPSSVEPLSDVGKVTIERWTQDNADEFLALLKTSGLECSDQIWQQKRALYCTDTFRCYVAKIEGKPCAWATSFINNEHAILANAYTQERYRSKGCQTALLRSRIEDAIALGAKVLLTDVMPNSTSSKNCKSIGFRSVGVRSVWCKD
ncbi:GNAT family N-acetyltransferase [Vibrio lentus]|uniref:GNAT family N-acetyltransferase n=1 Tax=Vibrio lentus TaxID=136468 RepID=UPI000C84C169|nr:GNAT family N-acetyltransferase [Vibrio lentus]PMI90627.1 acetyltransferase [Vibrio lentus]